MRQLSDDVHANCARAFLRRCYVVSAALVLSACTTSAVDETAPPKAALTPAPPAYVLNRLLGASQSALEAQLGSPALIRREGAGEYRRYSLSTCSLIVILYPDENGVDRVAHVEAAARKAQSEKPNLEKCLAAG